MNVKPKDIGAFRGRLRHLRNIGLPRLPKIGSGRAIDYSDRQALEMLLALELEDAGQTAGVTPHLWQTLWCDSRPVASTVAATVMLVSSRDSWDTR